MNRKDYFKLFLDNMHHSFIGYVEQNCYKPSRIQNVHYISFDFYKDKHTLMRSMQVILNYDGTIRIDGIESPIRLSLWQTLHIIKACLKLYKERAKAKLQEKINKEKLQLIEKEKKKALLFKKKEEALFALHQSAAIRKASSKKGMLSLAETTQEGMLSIAEITRYQEGIITKSRRNYAKNEE